VVAAVATTLAPTAACGRLNYELGAADSSMGSVDGSATDATSSDADASDLDGPADDGGPGDFTMGLLGHWRLDESGPTVTAVDSAGSNDGTLMGFLADPSRSWLSAGRVDGALDFDGDDDMIFVGDAPELDNVAALSVAVWIRPETVGENTRGTMVSNAVSGDNMPGAGWTLRVTSTESAVFQVDGDAADLQLRSSDASIAIGAWRHVIDGSEATYDRLLDGGGARVDDSAATLRFGETPDGSSAFDGVLDDIRIYDRILSPEDVRALYDATR